MAYQTWYCVISVHNLTLHRCHVCYVCNMTVTWVLSLASSLDQSYMPMIQVTYLAQVCNKYVDGNTRLVMRRWKVTVEIQDSRRKDAEGIRNLEKHLRKILIFILS